MVLIYVKKYNVIDSPMSDSKVGGNPKCKKSYLGQDV